MTWIIASFFMFLSSVVLYLLIRRSSLLGLPTQLNNFAMFGVPLFVYIGLAFLTHTSLAVTPYEMAVILFLGIFFSYLGNAFSLQSIELAPNPGYSLVISKSYVVLTTIVAVIAFQSPLSLRAIVAIAIILLASPLIMVAKHSTEASQKQHWRWLLLALGAFFCWGMLTLTSKYLHTLGVNIFSRLIYSTLIVSFLIMSEIRVKKIGVRKTTWKQMGIIVLIGIAAASFNYFLQLGIDLAPNIGYINAINASSIAAVAVCSALLFHDELTPRKFAGVVAMTIGVILLVL